MFVTFDAKLENMKKVYHLGTCSTCMRILNEINTDGSFELQDIKTAPITEQELEYMRSKVDSYEALFSKRAMKYRSMGLNEKTLSEDDFKQYILEEYTFLKRPVVLLDDKVFVGNSKKTVAAILSQLNG